jgi:hypothetical protein
MVGGRDERVGGENEVHGREEESESGIPSTVNLPGAHIIAGVGDG